MIGFTFEVSEDSLYMSQEAKGVVLEDVFVRPAEVPKHLWGKVLSYERKLRSLIGELKEYSV